MLRGVVTGTSSGSPCMDAISFLYTTLAIRKEYPIVIYRKQQWRSQDICNGRARNQNILRGGVWGNAPQKIFEF